MSASLTLPSAASSSASLRRRGAIALLLAFALIWFSNLEYRRLVHPDEGRYAEIPREMAASGDWVTPRLNGIKYFEKPALQYWLTAAAYEAFGVHQWTARLWPALSGFLGFIFPARLPFRQAVRWPGMCVLGASAKLPGHSPRALQTYFRWPSIRATVLMKRSLAPFANTSACPRSSFESRHIWKRSYSRSR